MIGSSTGAHAEQNALAVVGLGSRRGDLVVGGGVTTCHVAIERKSAGRQDDTARGDGALLGCALPQVVGGVVEEVTDAWPPVGELGAQFRGTAI